MLTVWDSDGERERERERGGGGMWWLKSVSEDLVSNPELLLTSQIKALKRWVVILTNNCFSERKQMKLRNVCFDVECRLSQSKLDNRNRVWLKNYKSRWQCHFWNSINTYFLKLNYFKKKLRHFTFLIL